MTTTPDVPDPDPTSAPDATPDAADMLSGPDAAADVPDGTGPPEPAPQPVSEQLHEVWAQLAQLQIQTHTVLAQVSSVAARVTTVEDRSEVMGAAMDAVETLLAAMAAPAGEPDPWSGAPSGGTLELAAAGADQSGAEPDPDDDPDDENEDGGLDLPRLVAWVRDTVAVLLERKIPQTQGGMHWCRQWWQHSEAIARFEALRRCWAEAVASPEGAGLAIFFEHLDHHLAVLTSETGPFAYCARGVHAAGRAAPLGQDEPSERYFIDFDDIRDAS